ncbi:GDSL-type esterase/lipase family protein [Corynebacterium tapiri]|uniref:SGNH hydrolase-type esterase domain-containing protein n=1 Tax=Corynebacterium tapiri TaxID=1448266 RepID=A0A5C4U7H1_9CORY|nr:GDSL-type esterase/lipase family protein [Corynebacterium tapiri]TNM00518.1 hypothetical protein FHE74_00810 [Corynebacterium tapiri]
MSRLPRTLAVLAASAMVATGVAAAPLASAASHGAVVVGDSIPANPTFVDYFGGKGSSVPGARTNNAGCGADGEFPRNFGAAAGMPTSDYSCPGASYLTGGQHVKDLLGRAAAQGDLNPSTREVVLFAGANDVWPKVLNGGSLPDAQNALKGAIVDAVNTARHFAPNAEVKVVGYPEIAPNGSVCPMRLAPGSSAPVPAQVVTDIENAVQWAAVDAARETGATFVDSKPVTRGHGICGEQPWMAGIIDAGMNYNIPLHMSLDGIRAVGHNAGAA